MNYSEFYSENSGNTVRVEMMDGEVFVGELFAYTSAADNDPNPESIVVNCVELFTNEIASIGIL